MLTENERRVSDIESWNQKAIKSVLSGLSFNLLRSIRCCTSDKQAFNLVDFKYCMKNIYDEQEYLSKLNDKC